MPTMSAASPTRVSYEEYLLLEETSQGKHEWCDGVVYAMSRGSPEHGRLTMRIGHALLSVLGSECEVFSSDTMLYVEATRLSTYADAIVVCGEVKTRVARDKNGTSIGEGIVNPTVLVEVLSESTERYDRDGKFQAYKQLPSLEEYVLVSQHERMVEVYRRQADGEWSCQTAGPGGEVNVHGQAVRVDDVYGPAARSA
jgi:Uma2 family endonuclease